MRGDETSPSLKLWRAKEVIGMKKRKVTKRAKTTKTRTRKTHEEKNLIYGLEQEFVLIFGGGAAVIMLGVLFLAMR